MPDGGLIGHFVRRLLHWRGSPKDLRETPMDSPVARLYTRRGCHLCEVAEAVLVKHGVTVELVDIDASPELRERYRHCVPVVEIDGRERFRGRVDERLLWRLLRGRSLRGGG